MQIVYIQKKKYSTLLVKIEIQIKTTSYHLASDRMAIIKNLQIINAREAVDKKRPFYTIGRKVSW